MAYRSVAVTTNTNTSNHVANVPAGATTGDGLLAFLVIDVSQTVNTPAGWTALSNADLTGPDGQSCRAFYRAASGSEPASYTFTASGSNSGIATMVAFSGRDTGSAPVAQSTLNTSSNATPIAMGATGVTAVAGDDIAAWYGLDQTVGADTWSFTPPSGYTERADSANGDWCSSTLATVDNASAGATGTLTATATRASGSGNAGWAGIIVRWAAAGGGGTPVGLASETDTALALTGGSTGGPVGRADETDTAVELNGVNFAQAEDLFTFGDDTGNESSMGGIKLFGGFIASGTSGDVGLASETDTALPRGVARPVGLGAETDSALALSGAQLRAAGLASETDTAFARTAVQIRAVGLAVETDTALSLVAGAGAPVGLASETDTALALSVARPAGVSLETDAALALAAVQLRAVGLSAETDSAFARGSARPAGLSLETDAAFALTPGVANAPGIAVETDTALPRGSARPVAVSLETDSALSLAATLIRAAGLAAEADVAFALSSIQRRQVGVAVETDSALQLFMPGAMSVGLAVETDTALSLQNAVIPTWPAGGRDRIGPAVGRAGSKRIGKPYGSAGGRIGPSKL